MANISALSLSGRFLIRFCGILLGSLTIQLAAGMAVHLSPSEPSPQPLGTAITWQASATGVGFATVSYRFSVAPLGSALNIVRDYESSSSFQWIPSQHEGIYVVQATARNNKTLATAQYTALFQVTSLVTDGLPVVTATAHPLVALFSAPACPVGSSIAVELVLPGTGNTQWTPMTPCVAGRSMNFYMAGMRANTTYSLLDEVVTGSKAVFSSPLSFTAGSIPSSIKFPNFTVQKAASFGASLSQNILLHSFIADWPRAVATDFYGNVIWYYPELGIVQRPLAGGTMLMTASAAGMNAALGRGQLIREIDLAGNTLREASAERISEELAAMGETQPIDSFNHEVTRLPNGYTAVVASLEGMYPAGTQGSAGPVDILGNIVIVLDDNWQVVWYWNSFDHLDIARGATLGDVCTASDVGCPPLMLATTANDWTHANSICYSPTDGNLIVSLRAQDWVIKIDYNNGAGTGDVIWRLGMGGDFSINSTDPYPWFSHQHDATYLLGGTSLLALFDNGNTRVAQNPGLTENSRGQVLQIDEASRSATLVVNQDLGTYSQAFGSAQLLGNGNYDFMSGWVNPGLAQSAHDSEYSTNGTLEFELRGRPATAYRSFRMASFYNP
jgi:arylsulfate sulfotransferase